MAWSPKDEHRRPKLDLVPELLAFVAHVLLVAATLWALGFSVC